MSESRFYQMSLKGKLTSVDNLTAVLALVKDGGFMWLDYCQPTKEELSVLIEPLGIHPLAIEDCTDENQVPKIDDFPSNTLIIFNAFSYHDKTLVVHEVDLIIGKNFLITVSGYDAQGRCSLHDIERVVERDIEGACQGPDYLMHVILDHIVDEKFVAIEALEDELDSAEEALLADPSGFTFGKSARFTSEQGFSRMISKAEALKVLKQAEEAGLVHKAYHPNFDTSKDETSICNCCKCCCGNGVDSMIAPITNTTYYLAVVNDDLCIGCGKCVEKCHTGAAYLNDDKKARRKEDLCIGCGVCAHFCPQNAISMREGERVVRIPPKRM